MSQRRLIRKIWDMGAEQPARVSTTPSSNSSKGGWRQSQAGHPSTWHLSHPALPKALLPSPERVAEQGISVLMQGEGLASPHSCREGQAAQVLPPDRRSEGKEMWAKRGQLQLFSVTLGSTTKHKLEMSQQLGTWVLPGVAHSVWLPSPDMELASSSSGL